jgi:hypothetical protein
VLCGFCFVLFCIGSIVRIIVLLIVANHSWNLLCLLLCPCWERTHVGSNFVVMSSKFVFSLFGFCSGTDWFCIVRRESREATDWGMLFSSSLEVVVVADLVQETFWFLSAKPSRFCFLSWNCFWAQHSVRPSHRKRTFLCGGYLTGAYLCASFLASFSFLPFAIGMWPLSFSSLAVLCYTL